jgi:predicted phosphohydrolase
VKIDLCSDLHLEFSEIGSNGSFFNRDKKGDILLIAGDSCESKHLKHFYHFFSLIDEKWPKTFIISGNHEHYGSNFNRSIQDMKSFFDNTKNIKFLHNDCIELAENWLLIGSTLWTDFCRGKPLAMLEAQNSMNDYNYIRTESTNYGKITPKFILEQHRKTLVDIQIHIDEHPNHNVILMVHHGVSFLSRNKDYNSSLLDGAYYSDLSDFILDNPRIKLIVHGHTHQPLDYMIGDCRIVCNPRGYNCEQDYSDYVEYQPKFIEVL